MKRIPLVLAGLASVALVGAGAAPHRTLRLEIFDRGALAAGIVENSPSARWVQQAFGDPNALTIDWILVPRQQEAQKLNAMLAAGDAPDLCLTNDAALVGGYAAQGKLADLTTFVQNAPTLRGFLGNSVLDYGAWKGKIFAIPGKRQRSGVSGTWIRKDWLDILGLPLPTSRDQWLSAVRAFHDRDPGRIGANLAPIGGGGVDANILYSFYMPSTERDQAAWIGPSSGRPGRDISIPGAKEGMRFLNMLQNEGLFQKNWALWPKNDVLNFQTALANGYVGSFTNSPSYMWSYNLMPAIRKNAPDSYWVPIDPFMNAEGKTPKYVSSPIGTFTIVPFFSRNADLVVKYLDWMADAKNLTKLMFGDEGVHYSLSPEGIILPKPLTGDRVWEVTNIMDRAIILTGRPYDSIEKAVKAQVLSWTDDRYTPALFIDHYRYMEKDGVPPVRIANPPESLARLGPMLLDRAAEIQKKLIMAKPSEFDALFDAGLNEWMDMGARQVKADMARQYDAEHGK